MAHKLTKFQVYYRTHREEISARRRERYRKDKKYRETNLESCRDWRARNKPWLKRQRTERAYLLIGEFAKEVGCSPETLRNLERKKLIPRTTNGTARRRYHSRNAPLVAQLVEFRKETHYNAPGYAKKLKALAAKVKSQWQKA